MGSEITQYTMTRAEAARQWTRVLGRAWPDKGKRQERYLPVEVITSLVLLTLVDPAKQGWGKYDPYLEQVARLCKRPPGSIAEKERNLDGSRPNTGAGERRLFEVVIADPNRFFELWEPVLHGARHAGIGPDQLPDVLDLTAGTLIGQESLVDDWEAHLQEDVDGFRAAGFDHDASERAAVTMARVGQHRFARRVGLAYRSRCGFCGLDTSGFPGSRLLIASHIKPWRDSSPRGRVDVRNGIAACPSHDAAFDGGLVTVTADGVVHTARLLREASMSDPSVSRSLSGSMRPALVPAMDPKEAPGPQYLAWHQSKVWRNGIGSLSDGRPLRVASESSPPYDPEDPGHG